MVQGEMTDRDPMLEAFDSSWSLLKRCMRKWPLMHGGGEEV
jgi:hypothetical protein